MSEYKMREALIAAYMAGNQHGHNSTVEGYWSEAEDVAEEYADEALAQQPAPVVELTDAEIKKLIISCDGGHIKIARAAIAAHEAKKNGGAA